MNRRVTGARILRVAAAVVAVATVAAGAARVYDVFCRERTPEFVGEGLRSPIRSLIALSFVLSPLAMRMAAGYYAEPMAALLVAMGLNAVKRGRSTRGWALVGVAALFRLECLVLAAALLLCGGVCRH